MPKTVAPAAETALPGAPLGAKNDGGCDGFGHFFSPQAGVPDLRYSAPNMRFAEHKENRAKNRRTHRPNIAPESLSGR